MMNNNAPNCCNCEYIKCIAISKQMYFCNHEGRSDDMGKLTEDNLHIESPEWCPLRVASLSVSDDQLI